MYICIHVYIAIPLRPEPVIPFRRPPKAFPVGIQYDIYRRANDIYDCGLLFRPTTDATTATAARSKSPYPLYVYIVVCMYVCTYI